MEVFLRGLPRVNENQLGKELEPLMEALGIVEYVYSKASKRDIGWITFIEVSDGLKFLQKHGEGKEFSLKITNIPVVAKKSTRPINEKFLDHIKLEQKNKARKAQKAHERNQPAGSLSFGVSSISCGKNVFAENSQRLSFSSSTSISIASVVNFTRHTLTVKSFGRFRFDIPCDIIKDFIVAREHQQITLVLTETPRFYKANREDFGQSLDPVWAIVQEFSRPNNTPSWERVTHCPSWPDHEKYVQHCLVYQLQVLVEDFEQLVRRLKNSDYVPITRQDLLEEAQEKSWHHRYATCMAMLARKLNDPELDGLGLPFCLLFQVQGLVWNNYLHPYSGLFMLKIMEKVARTCREEGTQLPFTVESMKQLRDRIPYPCPGIEPDELDIMKLLKNLIEEEISKRKGKLLQGEGFQANLSSHQAWVMKAMITPTRVLLEGPDAESKNRILRKYSNYPEYFLRCTFCDEDGQDLAYNPKVSNDRVYDRYRKVMNEGIQIAGRLFMFLGFSHSSLRSHSAWFVAPFTDDKSERQSHDTIIKGLGDFDSIRVPAKCAARIGQAFSETPFVVRVSDLGIRMRHIPDIKSADGSHVFSDGVGTISTEAMELFWESLPPLMKSAAPTCFQIRWGGAKGMLALDSTLKGKVCCIRNESMTKFQSDDVDEVGICDTSSRPLRLWLNRQMIKILEDMGTKDEWFINLQEKELRNLQNVTTNIANTSTFLRQNLIGIPVGFPKFLHLLDRRGIDYRDDVFMRTVVENSILRELRSLKYKARIPVEQGVTLFGIMDETGFLQEGDIYVTFDMSQQETPQPPQEGMVLVTRSPALHPGDIQVVRMVNPPSDSPLRRLENCIVFSQHGERDLPSKLSGGDLDGDIYSVIWDPEAMPTKTFCAAEYPRVNPQPLNHPVTREDIANFFINFMKTDILGMIATRHLIMADIYTEGTLHPDCLKLAGLHSTAVDSSKSGMPVNDADMPKAPKCRPDFLSPVTPLKLYDIGQVELLEEDDDEDQDDMGPARHKFYESKKILGKLYRSVDEKKIWEEDVKRHYDPGSAGIWETLLSIPPRLVRRHKLDADYKRQLEQARKIRKLYESAVEELMYQFSETPRTPISEVEVFCGFVLNRRGRQARRVRDYSMRLREETERTMAWIMKLIQEPEDVEGRDSVSRRRIVLELSWACLVVGCDAGNEEVNGDYRIGDLKSFKVLAACCLFKQIDLFWSETPRGGKGAAAGGFVGVGGGRGGRRATLPLR